MALINNTTVNTRFSILFDSDVNSINENNGPRSSSGNTESDVYVDENENQKVWLNVRSHTEVPDSVHAFNWNVLTNTGTIEYVTTQENEVVSIIPQWATNVVIRVEASDIWNEAYIEDSTAQLTAWTDLGNSADTIVYDNAQSLAYADLTRNTYLSDHGITY